MLELDAGFAGGVCRCSNCGTLMTVPSDAGKAESLTRPTSSASVGAGGLDSMGVPDPGPKRSSRSKSKRGKKGKGKSKRVSATVEAGEYRTASGKVVRLDEPTRVPMAESKKKQIRLATTAVFFAVVAAVVAIAVVAIVMITSGPGGPGGGDVAYDPAANPYALEFANVMGLPVVDTTVVVIEASEYSAEWSATAADMISAGLSKSGSGEIVLIEAKSGKPALLTGNSPIGLPLSPEKVIDWFGKMSTEGQANVPAAITAALKQEPNTLIVLHGYAEMSDIEAWDALVAGKEGLTVHTIHIGNSSPELEGWAGERGGEAVVLSIDQIEYLKENAAEESSEEE
jgi:hypothetical protein